VALVEYTRLTLAGRPAAERAGVVLVGSGLYAALVMAPQHAGAWAMVAVVAASLLVLVRVTEIAGTANRLLAAVFGAFYVGGLLAALPLLHRSAGPAWVALAIAVSFGNDTGAYFAGRAFGRRKLAPAISPGKTVEGAVGGLVVALAVTSLAGRLFMPELGVRDCLVLGFVASVVGPAGDLIESLLKRTAGVKDSGRAIPGHGGVLDRIDALLFVGAYVYLHASLLR
jgi:phosphatidate cytidylyltransferase